MARNAAANAWPPGGLEPEWHNACKRLKSSKEVFPVAAHGDFPRRDLLYKGRMHHTWRPVFLLLGLALAGCGGSPAPEAPAVAELPAETGSERGIILGARPLGAAPATEVRRQMLTQVLAVARGPGAAPGPGAVELTIRLERGGRDVALVQGAESWLQPGQRVRLTPAGVARDG